MEPWEPDPVQLTPSEFEFYNRMRTRAVLRAMEDLISVEANWHHYVRSGNGHMAGKLYEVMQNLFPFLDYEAMQSKTRRAKGRARNMTESTHVPAQG